MLIHNFLTFADHRVCETLGGEEESRGGKCQKRKKKKEKIAVRLQPEASKVLWAILLCFCG